MATFNVHASWLADSNVPNDAVLTINQTFRRDDEVLCAWVDQDEPRRFLVSFDVVSADYANAARECLATVEGLPQVEPRLGALEEVGATDETGYLVVGAEDFEELRHLPD